MLELEWKPKARTLRKNALYMKNADTQSPLNCVPLVDENHSGTLKKVNHQLSIEMLFHLAKGYGTENAAFCGVFDGHGKNGHVVSKIVNSRLSSSLIRSQKKVHANIDTFRKGDKINHVISSKQEFSRMGKRLFLMLSE
ncbi:hypothetical protein JHK85_009352 [Glycine max]|nr:hypothetical protein JHK85_009352 [Glycine max]